MKCDRINIVIMVDSLTHTITADEISLIGDEKLIAKGRFYRLQEFNSDFKKLVELANLRAG